MKKLIAVLMILAMLLTTGSMEVFAAGSSAETRYQEGMAFFERQDYERAFFRFQIAGEEKGYAPAQNMLGICYMEGLGTEKNDAEAEKYFKLAADQGNSDAKKNLEKLQSEKASAEASLENAYQEAMNLYFAGKYDEAKKAFQELGDYGRSEDFITMCEDAISREKAAATPTPRPTPTPTPRPTATPKPTNPLETEMNYLKWEIDTDNIEIVSGSSMNADTLEDGWAYAPRLKVTNVSDTNQYPVVTAEINGVEYEWDVNQILPGDYRGYFAGNAYEGGGTYRYTFYIDGKKVQSGSYVIKGAKKSTADSYYIIGNSENTFESLYKRMAINLDLANHPIPSVANAEKEYYGNGDYEKCVVLRSDSQSYEDIGYIYSSNDSSKPKYIVRNWIGKHEHGEQIRMEVFYSPDGRYIGNIRIDLTHNKSNSSSNSPYFRPSEGTHNLK